MQDIFVAIMAAIRIGCADKNAQVNIFAINLFLTVIKDVYKYFENMESKEHKLQFITHIGHIIDSLLTLIGERNSQLRADALNCLLEASRFVLMGAEVQIDRTAAADRDASGASQQVADEHYIARLNLLQNLIRTHRISKKRQIAQIVDYALSKLGSESSAVRINAYLTL